MVRGAAPDGKTKDPGVVHKMKVSCANLVLESQGGSREDAGILRK